MASKNNTLRQFVRSITVASTVPAANTDYAVALPAGAYLIALLVKSNVTGTTTTIKVRPFVGIDGDQANGVDLQMVEPNDSAPIALLTLPAGAAGRYATLTPSASASPVPTPIVVGDAGVQVTITKGGATTGETLEIQLIAQRI